MVQDKAVASPQLTPPRNAGRECRKTAGLRSWIVDYDHDIISTPPLPELALPQAETFTEQRIFHGMNPGIMPRIKEV